MEHVGVAWLINQAAGDKAPAYLGYLAAAQMGPTLVFGIPGGLLADRINRKTLLLVTQGIMMLIAAALAIASAMDRATPGVMLFLMLLMGITMAFNIPAWQVLTPRLVPREELTKAIFLNGLQFNMARIVGPGLGGLLLGWQGATILFVINTISFVGVMLTVMSTPDSPAPKRTEKRSVLAEIREAMSFTWHHRGARAIFIALTLFGLLAAPLFRMLPQFVSEVYETRHMKNHHQEFAYGCLLAMMGLGAVLGVVLLKVVPKWYPKHHLIPLSILLAGLSIALYGAANTVWLGAPLMMLNGAFWLWSFSTAFAALQMLVQDAMRGRVLAIANVATFGVMAAGPVLAGWLGQWLSEHSASLGIRMAVAIPGVILVLIGAVMLTWRTPEIDGADTGVRLPRSPGLFRGITAIAHRPVHSDLGRSDPGP